MNDLGAMIARNASAATIAAHLDKMRHDGRVAELSTLNRSQQRLLFGIAARNEPVGLDFFVPGGQAPGAPVSHHGTNTLRLPRPLRQFEKRFVREPAGERLLGYNEWRLRGVLGPGYFVAVPTAGNATWEDRGGVVVDYFEVPDSKDLTPEDWPAVMPNSKGLQRFVYHHTRDFLRRVSGDVAIGVAFRDETPLDHYFTLAREPV